MEYVYAAMILHQSSSDINEKNLTDVLEAAGCDVNEHRVKALVNSLEDVDIEEAIEENELQARTQGKMENTNGEENTEEVAENEPQQDEEVGDEEEQEEDDGSDGEGLGQLFG